MAGGGTKVIQITNIAPQATKDQMQSLFGYIGKIDEIRLYPTLRDVSCPVQSRICYVKYCDNTSVPVAQHLTNTVFIDRALIVIPVVSIPEEYHALEMLKNGTIVPGLQKTEAKLPNEVVNRLEGESPQQVIRTYDPKLEDNNLPEYPALPAHYDSRKIEEIRRTIIVCNVKNEWRMDDLMDYFARAGEVKYARWAEKDSKTYCMIEFCDQYSVINALKLQGNEFKNGYLNIYHSTDSIVKPEAKSNEAAQREIEEAMNIVKEAQNMISAAIDPVIGLLAKDQQNRTRSRSRSKERRHSRSRSRSSRSRRRSRSRHRSKRVKHSRSKSKRSRSHSKRSGSNSKRSRTKSRSASRKRSISRSISRRKSRSLSRAKRSRSRDKRKRSHSRHRSISRSSRSRGSRSRRNRSRSKDRKRSSRKSDKRRSRSRSKHSRSRSSRVKDNKSSKSSKSTKRRSKSIESRKLKIIDEDSISRDYDEEEKSEKDCPDRYGKESSVEKSDNMDISKTP